MLPPFSLICQCTATVALRSLAYWPLWANLLFIIASSVQKCNLWRSGQFGHCVMEIRSHIRRPAKKSSFSGQFRHWCVEMVMSGHASGQPCMAQFGYWCLEMVMSGHTSGQSCMAQFRHWCLEMVTSGHVSSLNRSIWASMSWDGRLTLQIILNMNVGIDVLRWWCKTTHQATA